MSHKKGLHGMLIYIMIIFSVLILLSVILLIVFKGNSDKKSVMLPIIMYHDVRSDPSTVDDYTISSDQLESDLTALENAGWQPITLSSMIDYVYHDGDLPQKPVLLVFDDGYKSFLTTALPILEKPQAPSVVSVIGQRVQNPEYNHDDCHEYMTWDDLRTAQQSGLVEFQSHSYHLHLYCERIGVSRLPCETADAYNQMFEEDIRQMRQLFESEQIPLMPSFAYPYGRLEPLAETVLQKNNFTATMTSEEQINLLSSDPESLFLLGRLNRSGYLSSQDVLDWIECQAG